MIRIIVTDSVLGVRAELELKPEDEGPEFYAQFDSTGEAIAEMLEQAGASLGEKIKDEYDRRDAITRRIEDLGR